jgi:hypothetical protein
MTMLMGGGSSAWKKRGILPPKQWRSIYNNIYPAILQRGTRLLPWRAGGRAHEVSPGAAYEILAICLFPGSN